MEIAKDLSETKSIETLKSILKKLEVTFKGFREVFQPKEYNVILSSLLRKFYEQEFIELLTLEYQKLLKSFIVFKSYPSSCIQQILNIMKIIEGKENEDDEEFEILSFGKRRKKSKPYRRLRHMIQEIVLSEDFPALAFDEFKLLSSSNRFFLSMKEIARIFVTVPDKVVGISNMSYFTKIVRNLWSHYLKLRSKEESSDEFRIFFLSTISLISKRGYCDIVCMETIQAIPNSEKPSEILISLLELWKSKFSGTFKKFIFKMIKFSSHQKKSFTMLRILFDSFVEIIEIEKKKSSSQERILTNFLTCEILIPPKNYHQFFYDSNYTTPNSSSEISQTFLTQLFHKTGKVSLALEHLLSLWKQDRFVKFNPEETQEGVTMMILSLFHLYSQQKKKSEEEDEEEEEEKRMKGLLHKLMIDGVNIRLDVTILYIRKHAILMAEKFSELMGHKTEFDEFKGEKDRIEEYFDLSIKEFNNNVLFFPKQQQKKMKAIINEEEEEEEKTKNINKNSEETKKKKKKKSEKIVDPDAPIFGDESSSSSEESSEEESEEEEEEIKDVDDDDSSSSSDESDVESLQAFGLDNEDAENEELKQRLRNESLKPPVFIRDLIPLITANSDDDHCVEKIELGLKYFEKMVRARPDDLDLVSTNLSRYLLHLNDPYSINGFHGFQNDGLVALAVCSTKKVVRFLINEFFLPRRAFSKRSLVLRVLRQSAMELSNREFKEEEESLPIIRKREAKEEEQARQVVQEKYNKKKTKIWGRFRKRKNEKNSTKKNKFLEFSEFFFYPLLSNYDSGGKVFKMLSGESFLFSEYLTTLTSVVFCCGNHYLGFKLSESLLEFLWFVKYHFNILKYTSSSSTTKSSLGRISLVVKNKKKENNNSNIFTNREKNVKEAVTVRRSVLHALLVIVNILPEHVIMENETRISEFVEWLIEVEKNDSDEKSREFSILILSTMRQKMKMV